MKYFTSCAKLLRHRLLDTELTQECEDKGVKISTYLEAS